MSTEASQSHTLAGFPAAAVEFVNAMQHNRERIEHEAGLSASELRALFRVAAEMSVTPKQLAGYLDMTTAAITFISRRLVNLGLLHRVDHPNDRRSLYLELTPRAHRMMLAVHHDFLTLLELATSDLSATELDSFSDRLRSVARSMAHDSAPVKTPGTGEALSGRSAGPTTHL